MLAVDDWQRIALAPTDRVARGGSLVAAPVCGAIFAVIAPAGHWTGAGGGGGRHGGQLRRAHAGRLRVLATPVFVACIRSSVDTFVMPLVASLGRRSLAIVRAAAGGLVALAVLVATVSGDVPSSVIAAFNGPVMFLPAAAGALLLAPRPRPAAVVSMNGGLAVAATVARDLAPLGGLPTAAILYVALARQRRQVSA